MEGELPSPDRFEAVVGALVDEVAAHFPGTTIHAFGEMVDLLWSRAEAAIALEERLSSAVDHALTDVVGPIQAARIYLDAAEQVPRNSVPRAQAVLGWLSRNDTPLAENVLARARAH